MNSYSIALFIHIVGALAFFVALGLEWTGLRQLGSGILPQQARVWMGTLKGAQRLGFASMLTAVLTGAYMMVTVWRGAPWLTVAVGSLVLVMALSAAFTGPRMAAIGRALATGPEPATPIFPSLARHPLLWLSIQTRVSIALGIVFLKVAKPDFGVSLLVIGVAIVLGVTSALPVARRERAPEGSAD